MVEAFEKTPIVGGVERAVVSRNFDWLLPFPSKIRLKCGWQLRDNSVLFSCTRTERIGLVTSRSTTTLLLLARQYY